MIKNKLFVAILPIVMLLVCCALFPCRGEKAVAQSETDLPFVFENQTADRTVIKNEGLIYTDESGDEDFLLVSKENVSPEKLKLSFGTNALFDEDGGIFMTLKNKKDAVTFKFSLFETYFSTVISIYDARGGKNWDYSFKTGYYGCLNQGKAITFCSDYSMSDHDISVNYWRMGIGTNYTRQMKEYADKYPPTSSSKRDSYFNSLMKQFLDDALSDGGLEVRFSLAGLRPDQDRIDFTVNQYCENIYYNVGRYGDVEITDEEDRYYDSLRLKWSLPQGENTVGGIILKRYENGVETLSIDLASDRTTFFDNELTQNTEYVYEIILVDNCNLAVPGVYGVIGKTALKTKKGSKLLSAGIIAGTITVLAAIALLYVYYPDIKVKLRKK